MTDAGVDAEHGVALAERVIAEIRVEPQRPLDSSKWSSWGNWLAGDPVPMPADVLARLTFPSGRPLPPSLRRWLAFDTSLLARFGWLRQSGDDYRLTPRRVDRLATDLFGEMWGQWFAPLAARFPECFWLPGGGDSRRALVVAGADEYGEYPVVVLDVDDMPCMELLYPGFDVYLADTAGLVEHSHPRDEFESYSKLMKHPTYGARMATHARQILNGETHLTYPF